MGFRVAHKNSLEQRKARVVIVTYNIKDIGCIQNIDRELKAYLKINIYLRWEDRKFLDKFRLALAHPKYFKAENNSTQSQSSLV